jgi:hypothetical protein
VAVIEDLRRQYKRDFILIRNETNSGSNINQWLRGLERASGDLVWIAEADDISVPKFLERLLPAFEDEQTLFAFSDSAQIDGKGMRIGESYHPDARSFGQRFLTVQNLILNVSAVLAQVMRQSQQETRQRELHLREALSEQLKRADEFRAAMISQFQQLHRKGSGE